MVGAQRVVDTVHLVAVAVPGLAVAVEISLCPLPFSKERHNRLPETTRTQAMAITFPVQPWLLPDYSTFDTLILHDIPHLDSAWRLRIWYARTVPIFREKHFVKLPAGSPGNRYFIQHKWPGLVKKKIQPADIV